MTIFNVGAAVKTEEAHVDCFKNVLQNVHDESELREDEGSIAVLFELRMQRKTQEAFFVLLVVVAHSRGKIEEDFGLGCFVIILEDILTTGGQVIEAAQSLKDAGLKIDRVVGVIDRMEGARQNIESAGYVFDALFTTKDLGI